MRQRALLSVAGFLFSTVFVYGQNIQYSTDRPRPGDTISFIYTPPAQLFTEGDPINCVAYKWGTYSKDDYRNWGRSKPVGVVLRKKGNGYEGTVRTDTFTRLVSLSFTSGNVNWRVEAGKKILKAGKADDNHNEGYSIRFYNQEDKVCRYSNFFQGEYLSSNENNNLSIANPGKAVDCFQKELELFPDSKYYALEPLINTYRRVDPEKIKSVVPVEIEKLFAGGLEKEKDLALLARLSGSIKLSGQAGYFKRLLKERSKNGHGIGLYLVKTDEFNAETDLAKKAEIVNELTGLFAGLPDEDKVIVTRPALLRGYYLQDLIQAGRVSDFYSYAVKFNFSKETDPYNFFIYVFLLNKLRADDRFDDHAEELALECRTFYSKRVSALNAGVQSPPGKDDEYYSVTGRRDEMARAALEFSDILARVYDQRGEYKKAFVYARDAVNYMSMLSVDHYNAAGINTLYCKLAEKELPEKECKAEVERLLATGFWQPEMVDILKRIWQKEKKPEDGFANYVKDLKQNGLNDVKTQLAGERVNEPAPRFVLKNMDGRPVDLADLKGKVVVLDFWATWCGPCKASFPGMQKLVTSYKDSAGVKFLFVDTWEDSHGKKTDQEKQTAAKTYIDSKKYSFDVLLDNSSKVVSDFKIAAIPTKVIIDKEGNIRYKVVGFETNEGRLFDEVNMMIESIK